MKLPFTIVYRLNFKDQKPNGVQMGSKWLPNRVVTIFKKKGSEKWSKMLDKSDDSSWKCKCKNDEIPQGWSGINPKSSFLGVLFKVKFMQFFRIIRKRNPPIPKSSNNDTNHCSERASIGGLVPIKGCPSKKY